MNNKLLLTIFIAFFLCAVAFVPQVSYCQISGTLTVTLITPADQSTSSTLSNNFTYTPIITNSSDFFVSATLFIDDVPTSVTNSTDIVNGTSNNFNYTFAVSGTYTWNVQVTNSTGSVEADADFTLYVSVPTPSPTATPTATPTTAPTATPTPVPIPTATPTPTPTPTKTLLGLSFLVIVAIAVGAIVIVGAVSAFFVTRKKVTEKSLKKSSPGDFQGWVIKRFNGKPGDPTSGVDGFTAGGQPLLIKQSDNVSLAEVEGFVSTLMKTGAQKGAIVAFNYDKDAADGKMKAIDQGIELEMLSIYQLLNKRFSDKIENIATMQVAFEAPREVPPEAQPPVMTEGQETVTFGGVPMPVPTQPQTEVLQRPVVYVSYSNTKILDQVRKLLEFLQYEYAVGDNEETPVPMSENKFGVMKNCDCAVIIISAIKFSI